METDTIICMVLSLDRCDQPLHNFQDPVSIFKQSNCQITLLTLIKHVQFSIGGNCSL